MRKVINKHGVEVDFEFAVNMMEEEIREEIHNKLSPCTDQEFFDAYVEKHANVYGEEDWQPAQRNPIM